MGRKIIGIVGETGSGKDTFCRIIKEKFPSVLSLRFSEPLSKALGLFFEEIKKEDQQWLASALRDRFGEDILMRGVAKKIKEAKEEIIVVNGIRVKEEFDFIKEMGGVVVYITIDTKKRWERIRHRGERKDDSVSYEKFLEIDSQRPEQQIKEIGQKADIVVKNEESKEDLEGKATELIQNLQ